MNREELIDLLKKMAVNDLEDGSDIFDHPCTVAARAINKSFEDVNTLCRVIRCDTMGHSKNVKMLIGLPYNPEW